MRAKHVNLPTEILILVSSSGFIQQAARKAKHYGIRLLSLEGVKDEDGDSLFGQVQSLWTKVLRVYPTRVLVRVGTTGEAPSETMPVASETKSFSSSGQCLGTIGEAVAILLNSDRASDYFLAVETKEDEGFELRIEPLPLYEGKPLCLQKTEPLMLQTIEMLKVTGSCSIKVSEFPIESGRLGDTPMAWGTKTIAGVKALFVASKQTSEVIFSIVQEPD